MKAPEIPPGLLQDVEDFADVLRRVHMAKLTGAIVIHFAQGHPNCVELPCQPMRIKFDKRNGKAQG